MTVEGIVLSDQDFKSQLEEASGLLLFYKKLCPNCRAMEKVIEKFLAAYPGVKFMRIDSEESPAAMKALGVERVPTLQVFREGKAVATKVGLMNLREMTDFFHRD